MAAWTTDTVRRCLDIVLAFMASTAGRPACVTVSPTLTLTQPADVAFECENTSFAALRLRELGRIVRSLRLVLPRNTGGSTTTSWFGCCLGTVTDVLWGRDAAAERHFFFLSGKVILIDSPAGNALLSSMFLPRTIAARREICFRP